MPPIRLPEWLPDMPDHLNPGLVVCRNVIPASGGHYEPLKKLVVMITGSPAPFIGGRCKGAYTARDSAGNTTVFFGYSTFLKKVGAGDTDYVDVSRASPYPDILTGNWRFVQFGERVIATSFTDEVQAYLLGTSTDFDDLSAGAPRARHVAIWNEFLVLGHLDTDTQGIQWSAIGDPTSWPTLATSAAKEVQSDYRNLAGEGGWVQALTGGVANADGLIFQERAVFAADYVGPPAVFRIRQIEGAKGTPIPNSVVHHGNICAYWSGDGFYMTDGASSQPIGDGKVDKYFLDNCDPDSFDLVSSTTDPERKLFLWNFYTGTLFKTLVYNWASKRWALWDQTGGDSGNYPAEWLFRSATLGYTVDTADTTGISIETTNMSADDRFWAGGPPVLAAFYRGAPLGDYRQRLALFTGTNVQAYIETGDLDLGEGRRVFVSGIQPFADTDSITCSTGYRNSQASARAYTTASSPAADGFCPQRIDTRFASVLMEIAEDVEWTKLWAYEPRFKPTGKR
jgi:hypothetical protein